jgi:hypothetical protein
MKSLWRHARDLNNEMANPMTLKILPLKTQDAKNFLWLYITIMCDCVTMNTLSYLHTWQCEDKMRSKNEHLWPGQYRMHLATQIIYCVMGWWWHASPWHCLILNSCVDGSNMNTAYISTRLCTITQDHTPMNNIVNYTHLILSIMYLSGMRPSWPLTLPRHQSLDTWENRMMLSPFLKLSSRSERAMKSNCAVASRHSDSATQKIHSHKMFHNLINY